MSAAAIPPMATLDSGRRWAIMGAVMLGLFLSAMDQTIVGTALPRIIADLSGLKLYAWVFTAYMLTSTTFVPIIGKMGDVYGRKNLFLIGVVVFLLGSILSGVSQSMMQLIIFRGIQGAGGGFIFANAFAIIGDLFSPAERGRYAGMMSGVFGLASVIGPLVGGGITDNLSWRWVFYVNIPLGLAALVVLALVLPSSHPSGTSRRVDYAGAATLAAAIAPLLLAFSWAGNDYGWTDTHVVVPFVLSAAMFAAFFAIERRADEPLVPLSIFRNDIFAVAMLATFVSGAAMFAGSVYIPLFMQGVLGFSATNAGLVLTPMTLALVAGSVAGGQIVSRTNSYRWICVAGLLIATVGMYLLSTMDTGSSRLAGMRDMAVVGFGLGLTIPSLVLAAQNAVPHSQLGVSTSLVQFARSVGGTIGVAIMGSILTRRLNDELSGGLPAEVQQRAPAQLLAALENPRLLLDDGALERVRNDAFAPLFGADAGRLFDASLASMKDALATSITEVFFIAMIIMAAGVVVTVFLRDIPLRRTHEMLSASEAAPEESGAAPAAQGDAPASPPMRPAAERVPVDAQRGRGT